VKFRCPAELPRDVLARLEALSLRIVHALGLRDLGRIDFRVGEDGRIYFLEANGLPNLGRGSATFVAAARLGLSYDATIAAVVAGAARRHNLGAPAIVAKGKHRDRLRVGFAFNVKRVDSKSGNDSEAEYDAPETIDSIRQAIQSHGHDVVMLEANADFPRALAEAGIDFVFNIAEGVAGRNREAAVPALCELMGLAYTGSDAATLSVALDKALSKKVLKQHGIKTAEFQLMETGREKLSSRLRFPLIVKPNQEGSSKGVSASASVVDDETQLRGVVRELIERYRQPALVEEYITGREFTVGLLGERRPRVLPPMEIIFKDQLNKRPVYDFQIKQDWERHVAYECPAKLTNAELKAVEKTARETFTALDCRDVGRVDLRMTPTGEVFVIEINPLPGLTPGYSDLCLIANAAGIDYRDLIGEILAGGLKRMRQRRRQHVPDPSESGRGERPKPPLVQRGNAPLAATLSAESGPLGVDDLRDAAATAALVRGA
jgi:D-alanine-D-alanine ligase